MIDIVKGNHVVTFPTKVASMMGQYSHVYNIVLGADEDNGVLASRGSYVNYDQYDEDAVTANAVEGIIRGQNSEGLWEVEITKLPATEVLYLYNSPVSEYAERDLQRESLFYNKEDEVIQGAVLIIGDVISYSALAFTGTPVAGKAVKYASKKFAVQA